MYRYKLQDNVYAACFNGNVILLDLLKDDYILLDDDYSTAFMLIIKNQFRKALDFFSIIENKERYPIEIQEKLEDLINQKIIYAVIHKNQDFQNYIPEAHNLRGNIDVVWRMSYGNLIKKSRVRDVVSAAFILNKIGRILKKEGFYGLIRYLEVMRNSNSDQSHKEASIEELNSLAVALDKACFYSFRPTKCLKWAAAFAIMCSKRRFRVNLNIGVQNYPFYAHAWIESNGNVIADHTDLSKNLAKILSISFGGKS
jgi:hypothetical protein